MNPLSEIIAREIRKQGVISFARFMELALYCPVCGYYEAEKDNLGKRGDFFTSVSVGPVFGELLAFRLSEWLEPLRSDAIGLRLVEAGAHNGLLARDILTWLRRKRTDLFEQLEYWVVEPSAVRGRRQKETLAGFQTKTHWTSGLSNFSDRGGVCGIIFSNELLDAFPVHRVGWEAAQRRWFEWGVGIDEGQFAWRKMGAGDIERALMPLPPRLLDALPDGFTTEISPAAENWWREAAGSLRRGKLMTIDFGLEAEEFFLPERIKGTLRAYRQHRQVADLLAGVGEQDLTAHVNFSSIIAAGESAGLKTEIFQTQSRFFAEILARAEEKTGAMDWDPGRVRQFQTLTHPEHLGRAFRVLVQTRA